MRFWKSMVPGVVFAGVLGALSRLLSPRSGTKRILRLCTVLFLVTSVCAGAATPREELFDKRTSLPQDYAITAVLDAARQAIERTAREVLDAHGLPHAQIRLTMTVRDGEAHTQTFTLYGVPPESAQEIKDEIFARTGESPDTSAGAAPQA